MIKLLVKYILLNKNIIIIIIIIFKFWKSHQNTLIGIICQVPKQIFVNELRTYSLPPLQPI
jgi:hypothetical protein